MASISGQSTSKIDLVDGFYTTQGGGGGTATLPTPTITVAGGTFGAMTVVVTNHSSYTNPNYQCTSAISGTQVVADGDVKRILDANENHVGDLLSFTDANASASQRTVTVKAQEFGTDIESAGATATYNTAGVQFKFLRLRIVTSSGSPTTSWGAINDLAFYESANGTGVRHPAVPMTSDSLPSSNNIRVLTGHVYSTSYAAWKAMDSSTSTVAWWPLSSSTNNYYQVEFLGTVPAIASMLYRRGNNDQTGYFKLLGSATGSFTGEETDLGVFGLNAKNTQVIFG